MGDGRPNLVLLHHDAFAINADPQGLPPLIEEIFKHKGTDRRLREFRNNLVFVVADERQVKNMKDRVSSATIRIPARVASSQNVTENRPLSSNTSALG